MRKIIKVIVLILISISIFNACSNDEIYHGKGLISISKKTEIKIHKSILDNTKAIKVTVLRKGGEDAFLVFKSKNFSSEIRKASEILDNGWEKITYVFRLPPFCKKDTVSVFLQNTSEVKSISFDKINIEIIENRIPDKNKFPPVELKFDSFSIESLLKYRKNAIKDGLIKKENKKWVDAIFISNEDTFNVKVRFKGDWLDHLQSNKWSLRISIKGDKSWNGFKTFSLQNPDSKSVFDEYIFHEILKDNNVLSPKYGFTPLIINGVFAGIFSYEEHFRKELIESQKRKDGPIIKFDEEPFWAINYAKIRMGKLIFPIFNAAKIIPFSSKRIKKNKSLKAEFLKAQNLLYTLKETEQVENIIDIESFAKFYAIVDLTGAYHSLIWHNIRFYYNPETKLLEPIAFDAYTEKGIYSWTHNKMSFECCRTGGIAPDNYIINKQFKDSIFDKYYFQYCKTYNSDTYLNTFFTKKKKEIEFYEKMLSIDYPNIKYNYNFLRTRANKNNSAIKKKDSYPKINSYIKQREVSKEYPFYLGKKYINIYPIADTTSYIIDNYNSCKLLIIGYSKGKNDFYKTDEKTVQAYNKGIAGSYIFSCNKKIKYIYFTNINKTDSLKIKVNKFVKPEIYQTK